MASMSATGVPVSGSKATMTPWCVGSAEPALRGNSETSLTATDFAEGRNAGMAASIPSWSGTSAAMRGGIEAAPLVTSTIADARASTSASRSRSSRTWASVRISTARPSSYRHHPVLLPGPLHLLGRGHLEGADDHRPRLAGIDDVVDEGAPRGDVGIDERAELLDPPRPLLLGIGGGRDLLPEDDIGPPLGAHDGDLRGGPGDDEVRLVGLAAHDEVARAVRLAD